MSSDSIKTVSCIGKNLALRLWADNAWLISDPITVVQLVFYIYIYCIFLIRAEIFYLQFNNVESPGFVGFANLPNQVHRKSVKKGFEFTLMVVGESGLGKSTLVNSLFLTDLYPERALPDAIGNCQIKVFLCVSVRLFSIQKDTTQTFPVSVCLMSNITKSQFIFML